MPAFIPYEERSQRLREQSQSPFKNALHLDNPDNVQRLRELFETEVEASDNFTSTSRKEQKHVQDMTVKFCEQFYPTYTALQPRDDGVQDALDLNDVPALVKRLKAFLSFLRSEAIGTEGKGRPSVKTMEGYVSSILLMVRNKVEQTFDATRVEEEKRRIFRYTGDGEEGVEKSIRRHGEFLCLHHLLPVQVFERQPYGWNEAVLLLGLMHDHIVEGRCDGVTPVPAVLETMLLVQLAFLTGLRVGSLVDSDGGDSKGIRLGTIRLEQTARKRYTLHFVVTTLKGKNESALKPVRRPVVIPAIEMAENIFFDPVGTLVPLLIVRGALQEKGGQPISSVPAFMQSEAADFTVNESFIDAPLFRTYKKGHIRTLDGGATVASEDQPLKVYNCVARLQPWIDRAGLPQSSLHLFRHDFAQQLETEMGGSFAQLALDHVSNPLNQHYTGGISLYNVSKLRLGEASASTHVSHLSRYKSSASVGTRATALRSIQQKETGLDSPPATPARPLGWSRARVDSTREDAQLQELKNTFNRLSKQVQEALGVSISCIARAPGIQKAQETLDCKAVNDDERERLSLLLKDLEDVGKQISTRHGRLSQLRKVQLHKQQRQNTRLLPVPSSGLPQVSSSTGTTMHSNTSNVGSASLNPESSKAFQPQPLSVSDLQAADDAIKGSHTARLSTLMTEDTSSPSAQIQVAQASLMEQYLQAHQGTSRFEKLQDWIQTYHCCPLCSVGRGGSLMKLPWASSTESLQGFIPEGLKHERQLVWEHLTLDHPQVVEVLNKGGRLHPGVFTQPNVGATFAQHPLVDCEEMLVKLWELPDLWDGESLALWLGAPSLVSDPDRTFLDGHCAGKRVLEKLSISMPITSTDDVGYLLDDFFIDRKRKSKRQNIDGIVKDSGVLQLEMMPRRSKIARPADLTARLAAKPMFASSIVQESDV